MTVKKKGERCAHAELRITSQSTNEESAVLAIVLRCPRCQALWEVDLEL